MEIKAVNLNKFYANQQVLHNLNFQVCAGQVVGFLGVNGAGKSTTMRILCGTLRADSGQVYINQRELTQLGKKARQQIGYLSEHNPLYGDLFVWEYLDFIARVYKIARPRQVINELLESLGIFAERKKKLEQLSKGYRQRVGLAAALIHQPEILILDEPTSGLDPKQMIEIRRLISEFGREKIVILSSHVLQEITNICNHILIIHQGKIVANSPRNELQVKSLRVQWHNDLSELAFNPLQKYCQKIHKDGDAWLFYPQENLLQGSSLSVSSESQDSIHILRTHILRFSMDNGWDLLSLTESQDELETIFQRLTGV